MVHVWTIEVDGTERKYKEINFDRSLSPDPTEVSAIIEYDASINYFDTIVIKNNGTIEWYGYVEKIEPYWTDEGRYMKIWGRDRKVILWKKFTERFSDSRLEGFFANADPAKLIHFLLRCPKSDSPTTSAFSKIGWGIDPSNWVCSAIRTASGHHASFVKVRHTGLAWTLGNIPFWDTVLKVDGWTNEQSEWVKNGSSPYLNDDDAVNYIQADNLGDIDAYFTFENLGSQYKRGTVSECILHVKGRFVDDGGSGGGDTVGVRAYIYYGDTLLGNVDIPTWDASETTWTEKQVDISSYITSLAKLNALKIKLEWSGASDPAKQHPEITYMYVTADGEQTSWQTTDDWFKIDLGAIKHDITGIIIESRKNSDRYARNYVIETSPDDITYTSQVSVTNNVCQNIIESWSPVDNVRYIRIRITADANYLWEISQIYIYQADEKKYRVLNEGPTTREQLTNGDFETGNLNGWTTVGSPAADASAKRSGNYGCALYLLGDEIQQTVSNISKSDMATFELYYRSALGNGVTITVRLTYTDASYTETNYSSGATTDWKQVNLLNQMADGKTLEKISIKFSTYVGGGDDVYLDDITLQTTIETLGPYLGTVTLGDYVGTEGVIKPINLPFGRLSEVVQSIVEKCHDGNYDVWEWWIDHDDGELHFAQRKGSDKSATISFVKGTNIESVYKQADIRGSMTRVKVIGKSESKKQDEISSDWQVNATGETNIGSFYEKIVTMKTVSDKTTADVVANVEAKQKGDVEETFEIKISKDTYNPLDYDVGDDVTITDSLTGMSGSYRIHTIRKRITQKGEEITLYVGTRWKDVSDDWAEVKRMLREVMGSGTTIEDWLGEGGSQNKLGAENLTDVWEITSKNGEAEPPPDKNNAAWDWTTFGEGEVNGQTYSANENYFYITGSNDAGVGHSIAGFIIEPLISFDHNPKFVVEIKVDSTIYPSGWNIGDTAYIRMGYGSGHQMGWKIYEDTDGVLKLYYYLVDSGGTQTVEYGLINYDVVYELKCICDWEARIVKYYINGTLTGVLAFDPSETGAGNNLRPMFVYLYTKSATGSCQARIYFYRFQAKWDRVTG